MALDSLKIIENKNKIEENNKLSENIQIAEETKYQNQSELIEKLGNYQGELKDKYGTYWFSRMGEPEKEKYVTMYSEAYNVTRESVENDIADSISKMYKPSIFKKESDNIEEKDNNIVKEFSTVFKGDYYNIINSHIKTAVNELKQIYTILKESATAEQIEEFKYLYSTLLSVSKTKTANQLEEQQKFTEVIEINGRIEQLQQTLNKKDSRTK